MYRTLKSRLVLESLEEESKKFQEGTIWREEFHSYTSARCPLEIIVGLFYMGTWGNKVTKVRADP